MLNATTAWMNNDSNITSEPKTGRPNSKPIDNQDDDLGTIQEALIQVLTPEDFRVSEAASTNQPLSASASPLMMMILYTSLPTSVAREPSNDRLLRLESIVEFLSALDEYLGYFRLDRIARVAGSLDPHALLGHDWRSRKLLLNIQRGKK